MHIEFYKHCILDEDIQSLITAVRSNFLTRGEIVHEFEEKLSKYTKNEFSVGLMSCTHALELGLRLFNIGPGDEVITTPMTFIATSNSILYTGAKPVFVDVEKETGNINSDLIENSITDRTKAILPVHLYGVMCDMKKIKKIADKYNLHIIEDAAHCIEGMRDGIKPGNLGNAACFSFYATKNITSGEGGAIAVHTKKEAEKLNKLSSHGMSKSAEKRFVGTYVHWDMELLGYKMNMSNIQAALLLNQLNRMDKQLATREKIAQRYEEAFEEIEGVHFPIIPKRTKSARHLFTIWVNSSKRDKIRMDLQKCGIPTTVNYRAVHLLNYYRSNFGYVRGLYPNAEKIGDSTITLPLYPKLTDEEIDHIILSVCKTVAT